jgi:hypothetical protein
MLKLSRVLTLTTIVVAVALGSMALAGLPPQKGPKKITPTKMKSFKPSGKRIKLKPATSHKKGA